MAVKLRNGVTLGDTLRHCEQGYEISKPDVATVFNGKAASVVCECCRVACSALPHSTHFQIGRVGGRIAIGCVRFSSSQVLAVKRWLKPKRAAAK